MNKIADFIDYKGHRYWYKYQLAEHRKSLCLATEDPCKYCNGIYLFSKKDPGDGKCFVIIKSTNPDLTKKLK